jgi:energy-coupling factor transport system ATP-binding protein
MDVTVLRATAVSFRYGPVTALAGAELEVRAGEAVGLFGPNGAGKTTLTRLAVALLQPGSGRVETAGRDTRGRTPEELADVSGYLFQRPEDQLFAATVHEEVMFTPRQLGWDRRRSEAAVGWVVERLGLSEAAGEHPYDLPRPMRRLVALASALVASPRLLVLDEPTAGLDRASRRLVAGVVREARERGAGVLAVTHDPEFAVAALDRGVVLDAGRVVAQAPLEQLLGEGRAAGLPLPPPAALARALGDAGPLRDAEACARLAAARCPGSGRVLS